MSPEAQRTFDELMNAKRFADRLGLNEFNAMDVSFVVFDEQSSRRALRIKDKLISDLKALDDAIKNLELRESDYKAISYLVNDRERMVFAMNRKLMDYNISLNVEK